MLGDGGDYSAYRISEQRHGHRRLTSPPLTLILLLHLAMIDPRTPQQYPVTEHTHTRESQRRRL
jgi:hypothetical protein